MKIISLIGAFLITFALLSYGVGSISLQRFREVSRGVLGFLSVGIVLDLVAITCMIIGSRNTPFTLHGLLGYSAFIVMLVDVILVWRVYLKEGLNARINRNLHLFAKLAYLWWVIAYITGSLLIILKKVAV